jgi:acetyl-CoA hydrolase
MVKNSNMLIDAKSYCLKRGWGHEPHLLWQTFKMHKELDEKGTVKIGSWG